MFHVKHIPPVDSLSKTYRTRLIPRFPGFATGPVTIQSRCFEGRLGFVPRGTICKQSSVHMFHVELSSSVFSWNYLAESADPNLATGQI
jgi:hypothetical protein